MKISELKDNWAQVRSAVMTKYPHVICVLMERDIEVDGNKVTLRYKSEEQILKKIAHTYIGAIYEGIRDYVKDEFTLLIKLEEDDGE